MAQIETKEETLYTDGVIRTVSGTYVNVLDPKPEQLIIEDIAHSLAMQPRWGGHCYLFFSVAQHSCNVSNGIPVKYRSPIMQLSALMHDASEAYLMDIPRPVKMHLSNYANIEDKLMKALAAKFGFEYPFHKMVKDADESELREEWEHLILKKDYKDAESYCLKPALAKDYFLRHFKLFTE